MKEMSRSSSSEQPEQTGRMRRVGLVGAGYIADWHAQGLRSVENVELVAVCDRALERAQALAGKFGVARAYGSLEEMLAAERLDAVHVLVPPDLHSGKADVRSRCRLRGAGAAGCGAGTAAGSGT